MAKRSLASRRMVLALTVAAAPLVAPGLAPVDSAAAQQPRPPLTAAKEQPLPNLLAAGFQVRGTSLELPAPGGAKRPMVLVTLQRGSDVAVCTYTTGDWENLSPSVETDASACDVRFYVAAKGPPSPPPPPKGAKVVRNADGSYVETDPDGTKVIRNADGSYVRTRPNGDQLVVNADGSSVETRPDGTKIVTNADGSSVTTPPGK